MKCPYCGEPAKWLSNDVIYGRRYGKSYMVWVCFDCDAYVGCHKNTKKPLGTMADKETREARRMAHDALDPIWRSGRCSRRNVYRILKLHFGKEIHIARCSALECERLILAIENDIVWPEPVTADKNS